MVARFWSIVDGWTEPIMDGLAIEQRASLRFVTSAGLLGLLFALLLIPTSLIEGSSSWVPIGMTAFWIVMLLVARRRGGAPPAAAMLIAGFFFLGIGIPLRLGAEGHTNLSWLLLVGLAPALTRDRRLAIALLMAALAGAAVVLVVEPPAATAAVPPLSAVIPILVTGYLAVMLTTLIQRRARTEVEAQLEKAQAQRRSLDAGAATLDARSSETLKFMTTMSHELRTPLNGVLGLADLLSHEDVSDATRERLDRVRGSGRAVLRGFNTLLFLVRSTVNQTAGPQMVDLPSLLDAELSRAAQASMEVDEENFQLITPPELPRLMVVDAGALKALLGQLLGLVADSRATQVRLIASPAEDLLALRIEGAGTGAAGLDARHREEIREMGLPLAFELARAVGGECTLVAGEEAREDLVIELTLPRNQKPDSERAATPPRAATAAGRARR